MCEEFVGLGGIRKPRLVAIISQNLDVGNWLKLKILYELTVDTSNKHTLQVRFGLRATNFQLLAKFYLFL
jgi:hypothetical protein